MPRIPEETLERIAAANDIVDVIGTYFPLKRAGTSFRALCPFHNEKSPSFHVNPARQNYHCFGCGAHGSVFRFLMEYESLDFMSAVKRLADRAGIPLEEIEFTDEEKSNAGMKRRLLAIHEAAANWFHKLLLRNEVAAHARDYLKSRGINKEIAISWRIGYAPEAWEAFSNFARKEGFTAAELRASGLVKLRNEENPNSDFYDRFRDRLMFPICNEQGEVIAFSGRVLKADAKGGKYVNSPETPLFTKGKVLFGLHKAKRALINAGSAIVCEGQLDLITAFEAGIQNVTAPQGTAFTERQAHLLKRHVDEVILCFDSDNAGQQAAERSLPSLLENNLIVRVALMPEGEDPDSTIRKYGAEAFLARIHAAKDFFEFQIERLSDQYNLDTLRGKTQFARRIAESIALIRDSFLREAVLNRVGSLLGMSPEDIRPLLKKARQGSVGGERESDEPKKNEVQLPPPAVLLACHAVLTDPQARTWFLTQPWQALVSRVPDCELLGKILGAGEHLGTPSAVNAFLATLDPIEEAALGALMEEKTTEQPLKLVQDWWRGLIKRELVARRAELENRLRLPGLPENEMLAIMAEIQRLVAEEKTIPVPL